MKNKRITKYPSYLLEQEKTIKAVVREIFVHLLFVLIVQLVCNASVDENSYWLAKNADSFMIKNSMTNSYFGGQTYVMNGDTITSLEEDVSIGSDVSFSK